MSAAEGYTPAEALRRDAEEEDRVLLAQRAREYAADLATVAREFNEFARAAEQARRAAVAWGSVYRRVRALRRVQDAPRRRTMRRRRLTFGRRRVAP